MPEQTEASPLCDVGGCDEPASYSWGNKWIVCGEHLTAHFNEEFDLDEYFYLLERKIDGVEDILLSPQDVDELVGYIEGSDEPTVGTDSPEEDDHGDE